jgi:hypothetical protein
LVNYLKEYEHGYFRPYFEDKAENGGSISIFEDPLGDSQAADFVSDNPNDKRNSVYSIAAIMERKIQIILYSSSNTINEDISNKEFPMLSFKTVILNPNNIKHGERGVYRLNFTNTGKSELVIKSITSSEAFASTQLKKTIFQPNENGVIYLLIQTEGLVKGEYSFELNINSNILDKKTVKKFSFKVLE